MKEDKTQFMEYLREICLQNHDYIGEAASSMSFMTRSLILRKLTGPEAPGWDNHSRSNLSEISDTANSLCISTYNSRII